MPGTDPMEALRLARRLCPHVPFIFLSGTMGEDTAIESLKRGASDYVLKQRIARLVPAVRRALAEAEEQARRQRAEEAVHRSEQRLRRLYTSGLVGVVYWDLKGSILEANDRFLDMVGYSRDDLASGRVSWQNMTPPEYHQVDEQAIEELKATSAIRTPFEKEYIRKDGSRLPVLIGSAMLDEEQVNGVSLILDITERKQAEEALRELNATLESKVAQRTAELARRARQLQKLALELSQAEERERRRIAVILHEDLQQQIAGAKFQLNLVRNRTPEDRLRAEVDKVDEMLNEAIEKSRSLSHDLSPAVLHMNDLAEVLQWLANQVRAQHGLVVNVNVLGDMMLHSEALALFLFRAAQEMLFNVVKHAHVREAAIRIRRIGRYVCLSVSDQGRGFDPQELKETSGVGLFGIRERTEMLGGRMKVKSAQGQGSRFSIMVPDGRKSEDIVGVGPRAYPISTTPGNHGGLPLRVLLVDDHDIVRQGLAALLQEAPGIELVGEAPDGRKAIDMTIDLQPDVVIMDVSMPLMGGDQATRQIKTCLPSTRVIALSMYDDADKKEKMFEAGAEGYILKTVSAEELLAAIRGPSPGGS